ncbi:MAG: divalent-cation tolerance protein CutA [Alphaproteobacteria bacterium]|nr:divalent-cation tolerance protein CutA [Alphaproteobacteria bacterium]
MTYSLIYITAASQDESLTISRTLVNERLVACVNILGGIKSVYWWEDKVVEEAEVSLLVKTKTSLVESVIARIKALHSYSCPCVIALPILAGNPAFLTWIGNETI